MNRYVMVLGPTATGKTRLGVALARRFNGEIVSADCRQVYRGLDIGTGKDLAEYGAGPASVAYHLIDVVDPTADYHLFRFLHDARTALGAIVSRGRLPIIVGGTPLYLNALLDGYTLEGGQPDPARRAEMEALPAEALAEMLRREAPDVFARTDLTQKRRVVRALEIARTRSATASQTEPLGGQTLLLAPFYRRAEVHRRIAARLAERLANGLIEEVRNLHDSAGISWERLDFLGLEYRYVARYLQGVLTEAQMRETLVAHIRQFGKSQDIWFRKMEREGKVIHWLPGGDVARAAALVAAFLAGQPLPPPAIRLADTYYGPRSTPPGRRA